VFFTNRNFVAPGQIGVSGERSVVTSMNFEGVEDLFIIE
jgi:hypothetical protein